MRDFALSWFNGLTLEEQLYKTIAANSLLDGDTVDNHPNRLSDDGKVIVYLHNKVNYEKNSKKSI